MIGCEHHNEFGCLNDVKVYFTQLANSKNGHTNKVEEENKKCSKCKNSVSSKEFKVHLNSCFKCKATKCCEPYYYVSLC